jgi:hypothetical protein
MIVIDFEQILWRIALGRLPAAASQAASKPAGEQPSQAAHKFGKCWALTPRSNFLSILMILIDFEQILWGSALGGLTAAASQAASKPAREQPSQAAS